MWNDNTNNALDLDANRNVVPVWDSLITESWAVVSPLVVSAAIVAIEIPDNWVEFNLDALDNDLRYSLDDPTVVRHSLLTAWNSRTIGVWGSSVIYVQSDWTDVNLYWTITVI